MDLCNLPEVDVFKHSTVYIDYFSRSLEARVIKDKSAPMVASFSYEIICRQCIMTWLQQQKTGYISWTKTSRLQSKTGVAFFASFWQEKPWRRNWIPSPFFVTVSSVDGTLWASQSLSHANLLNAVLESLSWQSPRTWKENKWK